MSLKNSGKNKVHNAKRCMDKIIVAYLIGILTIGTVVPTVLSDPARFYSPGSQGQSSSAVNQPPIFGTPIPANGSVNNSISFNWSIPINDPEGEKLLWTIQCSNGQTSMGCGQTNGTKSLSLSGLAFSTTYTVWVNASDLNGSGLYTRRWYTFTTMTNLVANNPPVFGTSSPANGSTGNLLSLSWKIPINDPEGNNFTWTIQCNNGQTNTTTEATNGTKTLVLSGLAYLTTYKIWVNASDRNGSGLYTRRWYTFTTRGNSPPVFGTASPANGSTGNLLSLSWSIPINDPEGNTYSWTIQCSNKQVNSGTDASNGTKSLSLSGLTYATTYKIWVNATDSTGSGLYTRKWYTFTTKQLPPMKVIITKPLENTLYIQNQERRSVSTDTIIYGPITIIANVTSEISITKVEFYIDGRLKDTVTTVPYTYLWKPIIQFHGFSLKHTIKVIAYDSLGNNASDELNVTKWRFHPLPFIAAVGVASTFFKHTTVSGLFFNVQQSMFTTSFYALHVHYSTKGAFKNFGGVINFKSCTGGAIIGPILSLRTGSQHNIMYYGTFTFLGDIQYTRGLRQDITAQLSPTTLEDMFQNLKP
jgi:hypothetical protein